MKKETLVKAKELEQDIRAIGKLLEEREKNNWIQVIASRVDNAQSFRFQVELGEWLREKKIQYEKELEEL